MPNTPTVIRSFQDCLASELNDISVVPGTLIYCRDTGENYYDNLEGERIPVSKYVYVFATESDRTSYLEMMSGVLYVVRATKKIYIYSGGWICLNDGEASDTYYFDIENLEVPTGATGLRVTDSRISTNCTGTFTPIASLNDLYGNSTVTCSNGYATIVLSNTSYPMIGTLKISGSTTFSST